MHTFASDFLREGGNGKEDGEGVAEGEGKREKTP